MRILVEIQALTHWSRDKRADISRRHFQLHFWMKMYLFPLGVHWSLSLRFEFTISQHWTSLYRKVTAIYDEWVKRMRKRDIYCRNEGIYMPTSSIKYSLHTHPTNTAKLDLYYWDVLNVYNPFKLLISDERLMLDSRIFHGSVNTWSSFVCHRSCLMLAFGDGMANDRPAT